MDSDHGGGSAGRSGSGARNWIGGGLGRGGSGSGSGGGGVGGENTYAVGAGGASAAAWIRLVSSGVEDELVSTGGGGGGAGSGGLPYGHFLEACFLCRKPLASNRDIYMYRGDIPFCSEECRREQMEMDGEMERKENTSKKVAPRAPPPRDVESPTRPPKVRAGSILAG